MIGSGVQVAGAVGVVSLAALYAVTGDWQLFSRLVVSTLSNGLRNDAMLAIPLLTLMGVFITRAGAATEVFWGVTRALRNVPGGAPLGAVVGSALNAFAAGGSTASVANFARIVYPELRRRGHDRAFSLGTLANASALGMMLPPAVLMMAWAVLAQRPAGAIFLAAVTPALLIAAGLSVSAIVVTRRTQAPHSGKMSARPAHAAGNVIGLILIAAAVFGGIGTRVLTPSQAAAAGAAIALVMALRKGMPLAGIILGLRVTVRLVWPVLLLMFMALLYAQALAVTGVGAAIQNLMGGLHPALGLAVMMAIWLVLATILNTISVLALTVALFAPVATRLGLDPLALAVIGIITVEAAQLLPPLGLLVYAAKAAADDDVVSVFDIFRFVLPFLAILLVAVVLIAAFPKIAVWLPYLVR